MASVELSQGYQQERSFKEKAAWWLTWGGLLIAALGAFSGKGNLIVPGLLIATGGLILGNAPK